MLGELGVASEGGGREGTPAVDMVDGSKTRKSETGQDELSGQVCLARAVSPGEGAPGARRGPLKKEGWSRRAAGKGA